MDRLVIESILADVDEIYLSDHATSSNGNPGIVLGFKAGNVEQIIHAFAELKKITAQAEVEFIICRTLVSGIYDLELKTDALDEPIRIVNKAISHELLGEIEDQLRKNSSIVLGTNVSEEQSWIALSAAAIKECSVK